MKSEKYTRYGSDKTMELQGLQEQLKALESERERISQQGLDTSFQDATIRDVKQHIAELEGKLNLELRVEEDVRDNGYVLDTMEVDGFTAPEIITDDGQYNLIRKGVQILIVGMNTSHLKLINALKADQRQEQETLRECLQAEITRNEQLQGDNKDLEVANYQLELENTELSEKVTKIAAIQYEAEQQIAQQKKHIEDLQNQIAVGVRGALNVVDIPQDTSKLAAEIIANKPRITDVKYKDEHGIDRRTKTAIEVLTGEQIEYQEYVEKRYIILNPTEAEQYRADEANKKAEAEAQQAEQQAAIPTLGTPDIDYVNAVTETDEAAEIQPFPEGNQVQTTEHGLADQSLSFSGEETDDHASEIAEDELNRATPANMSHIKALSDQIEFLKGSLQTTIARVDYMVGQAVA